MGLAWRILVVNVVSVQVLLEGIVAVADTLIAFVVNNFYLICCQVAVFLLQRRDFAVV